MHSYTYCYNNYCWLGQTFAILYTLAVKHNQIRQSQYKSVYTLRTKTNKDYTKISSGNYELVGRKQPNLIMCTGFSCWRVYCNDYNCVCTQQVCMLTFCVIETELADWSRLKNYFFEWKDTGLQ